MNRRGIGFLILGLIAGIFCFNEFCSAQIEPQVKITEIAWMGGVESSNDEWIELVNFSSDVIDLNGWRLVAQDGSPEIILSGTALSGEIFLLERTDDESVPGVTADLIYTGALGNDGEVLELFDASGNLVDVIDASDGWMSGDNETKQTMELIDGVWQNSLGVGGTPGVYETQKEEQIQEDVSDENIYNSVISLPQTISFATPEQEIKVENYEIILITEIFPNPIGDDRLGEFIEIYNPTNRDISLNGWQLGDATTKRYEFSDEKIGAGEYLAIYREKSDIVLNNTSDTVNIFKPDSEEPFQSIYYKGAKEEQSYCYNQEEDIWAWNKEITPGKENEFIKENNLPIVNFDFKKEESVGVPVLFDASDCDDIDGDKLNYFWDFGDGFTNNLVMPEHTFFKAGEYIVRLIISDGLGSTTGEKIINIESSVEDVVIEGGHNKVFIIEFLPNPIGADADGEWIEIYNAGDTAINLKNWKIDDSEGGSKPYIIEDNFFLGVGEYHILDREETGIALNNSADSVRLFDLSDNLVDKVDYEKSIEGKVIGRELDIDADNKVDILNSVYQEPEIVNPRQSDNFSEVGSLNIGNEITTRGFVTVLPGVLGLQYFYIEDYSGIQVYNYKKDFPDLEIGDYIEVFGELSSVSGEQRIKTNTANDILVINSGDEPIPEIKEIDEIDDMTVGCLVTVFGELLERKGSTMYLDDGSNEIRVYIKKSTGINPSEFNEGDNLTTTGIVSKTKLGLRLLPRSSDDIVKNKVKDDEGHVLGESVENLTWNLESRNKKEELLKYLLVISGGVIVLLVVLLIKKL